MGKFKIHAFGQEKAILNQNGLILRKRLYLETRPFHKKRHLFTKNGPFIIFDESSHDISFLLQFVFSA
jgi:hypothetical protein